MIGKYHNQTLQTNLQHREEEPQNTECHKNQADSWAKATSSLSLSLSLSSHQDD